MIRLLNVYYPTRRLVLIACEALLAAASFAIAAGYVLGADNGYIELIYENGLFKIIGITVLTMLFSYYFDLYEPQRISERWEAYFRLLLVLSALSFVLAGLIFFFPQINIGHNVLAVGIVILTIFLLIWLRVDDWLTGLVLLRERVFVLGHGARAAHVVEILRSRRDAGMCVVGWKDDCQDTGKTNYETSALLAFCTPKPNIDRVIVAMEDRRGTMPIRELLELRLRGVVIEDAATVLERLLGRLPLEGLTPSTLIFTDGFKIRTLFVVPDAAKRDFFYGINFEFSYTTPEFSLSRWALEVRPIIGWRNAQWELIFNPIVDATFGSHGEADFAPAVRLARKLDKDVFVGLEYYGDLGPLGNFLPLRDQQHTLFAVTDFKVGEFDVDFGIGYGLTAGSDRMAVKGILGYAFPVPGKNGDAGNDTPRAPSSPRNLTHNLSGSIFPADLPTLR